MREGMEVWRHKFMPYLEQDYTKLSAGDMYVCDHHEFKCFARYRGKTIRPWLTGIMDAATRVLVGWHVGPAPHTDAILASIRNAFEGWGVPRRVKIDNGKDYDSKVLTGTTKAELRKLKRELGKDWKNIIRREQAKTGLNPCEWFGVLPAFGCKIIRAIPYQPQSKLIERYFLTVSDQFTRSLATFCDTSPERKPEALPEVLEDIAAIPALEDLATDFAAWLEEYHHAAHRGDGMNGRSPLAAWESSPAQPAKAQADALGLMVNVRGAYKVGGNGVRVKIGATTIGYGQYDTSLQRWKGRKVLVAVASSDVSYALIYTPERAKRQLICRAEANERISPCATADDMREAQASINRARRDARRARDSAAATMKTTARVVREAAAHRRKELLRATGTDNATSSTGVPPVNGKTSSTGGTGISPASPAPITLVQTGFEEAAKQVRKTGVEQSLSSAQTQNEQRSPIVDFTAINDWMVGRSEPDETDKPAIANADAMLTTGSLNGDLLGDDWMPGGNESDESDKPAIANADAMLTTGCLDDDPILTDLDREDGSAAVDAFGTLERLIHGPRT
ncbi:MAG: DDE-type integrase/transposase/recombinase [Phycisphaerae bacterium]|nr:DDE-type integrase/transposase/recombinase [Phycisphaerae bacterium]